MTYKLPSGLASFNTTDCDEWTLPGRADDRNKALREALKECHRLQSERDAIIQRLLCLSVSGHSIIDLDRGLADLVRGKTL